MCFAHGALPPDLPGGHGRVPGEGLTLTSADGTQFLAHRAQAGDPSGAGIVILPDVRGLFPFYERLAEGFAGAGIDAIAIDYFGRTAGTGARGEDFEFRAHAEQTRPETVTADVSTAVDELRRSGRVRAVFTVGFCFGGGSSFWQSTQGHGLAGVVGFYGSPRRDTEWYPSTIDRVGDIECPVLGLFGGADQSIPTDQVEEFDRALARAGVEHEVHVYAGAPHSFYDRSYEEYASECEDAGRRMLSFVTAHTPSA